VLFTDLTNPAAHASTAMIDVGERPSIVRHRIGTQSSSIGGIIGAVLLGGVGGGITMLGGTLLLIGEDDTGSDLRVTGGITLGIGGAMMIGAWMLGELSRPTYQPGSTTQWTPSQ
jgi:hypothetical protein